MRSNLLIMAAVVGLSFSWAFADTVQLTLEDGTVIEIDGVPKGAKLNGRVIGRAVAKLKFNAKDSIVKFLKEHIDDASRLEIVKISEPVPIENCLFWPGEESDSPLSKKQSAEYFAPIDDKGVVVICRFRAPNKLGAMVIAERAFLIDQAGEVFWAREPSSVLLSGGRESRAAGKGPTNLDPFTQQFLKSADGLLDAQGNPKINKPSNKRAKR